MALQEPLSRLEVLIRPRMFGASLGVKHGKLWGPGGSAIAMGPTVSRFSKSSWLAYRRWHPDVKILGWGEF
ncbi:hypothetical protein U1Q18_032290 [Sarracenia purpurea var. burkii]